MRFLGNIEAKVDAKGRAFLPAAFRKVLQASGCERVVMRKDVFQPCITLYPEEVWNAQMDSLRARLNRWNAAHQQLFRQFVSDVEVLSIDGSGRILLPKRYMQMTDITSEVKFIGMGDTIEIWSASHTQQPFLDANTFGQALEEIMAQPQPETQDHA